MSKVEKISVVLPVYNGETTLELAVRSILEQRDADLRLYICDDASTDGTLELAQRLAESDARIILLHNAVNSRAGEARNRRSWLLPGPAAAFSAGSPATWRRTTGSSAGPGRRIS